MRGLETVYLRHLLITSPALAQGDLGQQGQDHRCGRGGGRTCVPWHLLGLEAQGQADVALEQAVPQEAHHRQPGPGGHPFGLLPPHGADGRRGREPAHARCHGRVWLLRGLEKRGIRPWLRAHRGGEPGPALVRLRVAQRLALAHEASARRDRCWRRLRWSSPTSTARAARGGDEARADRVLAPGTWATAALARSVARRGCQGGVGVWQACQPLGRPTVDVGGHRLGGLAWSAGRRLGLLGRPVTRRHDDKPQCLPGHPSVALLALALARRAVSMPAARRFVLGPPGRLAAQGPGGLRRSPGCAGRPAGTRARDERHAPALGLQPAAQRAATLRLPRGHAPAHACQASGETRLKRARCCHPRMTVASPHAATARPPASATPPQTQAPLLPIVPAVLAGPVGRPGRSGALRLVRIHAIERHGRGVLRQPGGRESVDGEGLERTRTTDLVEVGGQQRIAPVTQPIIMERGPREPRLHQRHHPALFQPLPHRGQGLSAVQHRPEQGFAPTPSRAPMPRVRWEEVSNKGGDLQASSYPQPQGHMCYGTPLLHRQGHEAPPVVTWLNRLIAQEGGIP